MPAVFGRPQSSRTPGTAVAHGAFLLDIGWLEVTSAAVPSRSQVTALPPPVP
jgi:hypothetical protein